MRTTRIAPLFVLIFLNLAIPLQAGALKGSEIASPRCSCSLLINKNDLRGIWLSDDKNLRIEIYEVGGKYYGKQEDGHAFLNDFVYDPGENAYQGILRSPGGNELQATIVFMDKDTIRLTARKLMIKKTYTFSRIKQ